MGALAGLVWTTSTANAQEEKDGVRFRGGAALEGGAYFVPDVVTLGLVGAQGQLGVQINNLVGIVAVPSLGAVLGEVGGFNATAALIVDFTFGDIISVGAGPDVGAFAAIGSDATSVSAAGGALYGGRLHLGFYPLLGNGDDGVRRKALAIGVDLRALGGGAGFASSSGGAASGSVSEFVLAPMLSVGYLAF